MNYAQLPTDSQESSFEQILQTNDSLRDSTYYQRAIEGYSKGIEILQSLEIPNHNLIATFYTHRSVAYNMAGRFKEEINDNQLALEAIKKAIHPDPILLFKIYIDHAVAAEDDGQLEFAKSHLLAAERVYHKYQNHLDNAEIDAASFYTRLQYQFIRIHEHSNDESAIRKCISNLERHIVKINNPHSGEFLRLASAYNILSDVIGANGGTIYTNLTHLNKALSISKKHSFKGQERIALFNIAKGYYYEKDYLKAIPQFQSLIKGIGEEEDFRLPYFHAMLTMSVREQHGLDSSSTYLEEALQLFSKGHKRRALNELNQDQLELSEDIGLASLWATLALPYLESFREGQNIAHLNIAYQLYIYAAKILNNSTRWDTYSSYTEEVSEEVLSGLLQTISLKSNGRITKEEFNLVNLCREDYIWKRFLAHRIKEYNITDTTSTKLNQINSQIINLLADSLESRDSIIFDLKAQRDALSESISDSYRGYYSDVMLPEDLVSTIPKGSKLLRYYIEQGQIFLIEEDHDSLSLHLLPDIDSLSSSIRKMIRLLGIPHSIITDIRLIGERLYDDLIGPVDLTGVDQLIIIRDQILHALPFEVLQYNGNYIVQDIDISYASSTLLYHLQNSIAIPKNPKAAVFYKTYGVDSDVYTDTRTGNKQLLGTQLEAIEISRITDAQLYDDDRSNKQEFQSTINDHDIIHISTHAVVDNDNPELSHIVFDIDDPYQNLYIEEIKGLHIPAEMVVLSACETGVGSITNGEGVRDMSRAFTIAGSKSALVSLWQVPDEQSATLMTSFYKELKNGMSRSRALSKAKRTIINQQNYSAHPYYWAAWTLVGADGPVWASGSLSRSLAISIFIITLFILLLILKKINLK